MRKLCVFGLVLFTAVLLATCGCTTTPSPPATTTENGQAVQTHTVAEQGNADMEFLTIYENSAATIVSRLELVNSHFYPATQDIDLTYSPSKLRLAALDVRDTAEEYHTALLKIEKFENKENEYLRNEYLGYLSSIRTVGENIAEAALAEGAGDYKLAMNYAELAKTSLERIGGVPDEGHEIQITVMESNLLDMITRMKEAM